MNYNNVIEGKNIIKKFKNFTLDIPELNIPEGLATALIGENGAGKTTLLNILAGIRLDNEGELRYFGGTEEDEETIRERIGYTGTDSYYLPSWSVGQIIELYKMLFETFDENKFKEKCEEIALFQGKGFDAGKKVSSLSDGTKTKLMLAGVLARKTDLLIMDEPASPLDPLMRDKLCDLIRDYMAKVPGRSVFFSTHNISDMENVTDYAIIMAQGHIAEAGLVDDLKEKYLLVKGEPEDAEKAAPHMFTITKNKYGFEGICLAENLDRLAGLDIKTEQASLFAISVAVMKRSTHVK